MQNQKGASFAPFFMAPRMPIPPFQTLLRPTLELLADKAVWRLRELEEKLAQRLGASIQKLTIPRKLAPILGLSSLRHSVGLELGHGTALCCPEALLRIAIPLDQPNGSGRVLWSNRLEDGGPALLEPAVELQRIAIGHAGHEVTDQSLLRVRVG